MPAKIHGSDQYIWYKIHNLLNIKSLCVSLLRFTASEEISDVSRHMQLAACSQHYGAA